MKNVVGALALCLAAALAQAQPAYRVKDVRPLPGYGSAPRGFMQAAGAVYFIASDEANGEEVWRTDGTASGTRLLKDVVPGPSGSFAANLTEFDGSLFFTADQRLWRSNGTSLATQVLRADLTSAYGLAVHGGALYFAANDGVHGQELWRTDGSEAGTVLVKDVRPGPEGSQPSDLVSHGDVLYFVAIGPGGKEPWRSDGTEAGTLELRDVAPGPAWSQPGQLTPAGAHVFFVADDGVHGEELWASGIASGVTAMVRDIAPGASGSFAYALTASQGILYFAADDGVSGTELWRSDGTEAGTFRVRDLAAGSAPSYPSGLTVVGDTLYFALDEGDGGLWRSDGTDAGTQLVSRRPGLAGELTAFEDRLVLSAWDSASGFELWTSDGTEAGTLRVDLRPGPESSGARAFAVIGGRLYFRAVPPDAPTAFHQGEPWIGDATAGGSAPVAQVGSGGSSGIETWGALGGVFYFGADDGVHGTELWRSDGTEAGTTLVRDLLPGVASGGPGAFTVANGTLFFTAWDGGSRIVLWRTDGTAAGTVPVTGPGHPLREVRALCAAGATLYLRGTDDAHGAELWRSDGTEAGTVLLRDIFPGTVYGGPDELTAVGGLLFFTASDPDEGRELWRSDGTAAGTVRVRALLPGPSSSNPRALAAAGGVLYFSAEDGLHGGEPWRSDGTAAGTVQVRDVRPGPASSAPLEFIAHGGVVLFTADDGTTGHELWRTDGSDAGTARVLDIRPGPLPGRPFQLTRAGDRVVFGADDGVSGRELWATDGTTAGTALVRDVAPGADSSLVLSFDQPVASWGGWTYFGAGTPELGQELWRTDGTGAGTALVQDLVPGPPSSGLRLMAPAGGRFFLRAVDAAGPELWALRPELTLAHATAPEGTHALVDVTLVPRLDVPLAVPFATVDNSAVAGSDFQAKSGVLTFAPGKTLQTVDVTVLDDVAPETVEQFFVDVAPAGAFAALPRGIVTVLDDDPEPTLTVDDAAVIEGNSGSVSLAFTVRLSAASAAPVTVGYATADGTAGPGDFGAASGTLTFTPGVTALTVAVSVWGDVVDEPDEFFSLRLSSPAGAVATNGYGTGRIGDDDGAAIRVTGLEAGMDVTATVAGPGPALDGDLYLVELAPFASYEVTVDAASGDLGDFGPAVEVFARDMTFVAGSAPSGVGHARTVRMIGSSSPSMPTLYRYVRVRSAGCTTDCGADDTYRIRLRETTGRVARFNQAGGQRTVMILHNTTDEWVETEVHWRRADGTYAGANLFSLGPRRTMVFPAAETTQGASGSILVLHDGPLGALAGKAVGLDETSGMSFDTPMTTRPR